MCEKGQKRPVNRAVALPVSRQLPTAPLVRINAQGAPVLSQVSIQQVHDLRAPKRLPFSSRAIMNLRIAHANNNMLVQWPTLEEKFSYGSACNASITFVIMHRNTGVSY